MGTGRFRAQPGSNEEGAEFVLRAIEYAGYKPGDDVLLAFDAAASEFYDKKTGLYRFDSTGEDRSSDEMVEFWADWRAKYPIISIEDGLDEDDWVGWKKLTDRIGGNTQLVGDDLFVTNVSVFLRVSIRSWKLILVKLIRLERSQRLSMQLRWHIEQVTLL